MRAHPHPHRPRTRPPARRVATAALGATLIAGVLVPAATAAPGSGQVTTAPRAATSGPEEAGGTPLLSPTTGTFVDGTVPVVATPVQPGDPVDALAVDGEVIDAAPTPAVAHLSFEVGSNSIEARYASRVLVNGEPFELDRDMVSERVSLDVPADVLVQGENAVRWEVGAVETSCGTNVDDYDVTDVSLELLGEVADGGTNEFTYQFGDGSCGSNIVRVPSADLTFDLVQDPGATTGLAGELDTTTLENGDHTLTATTAAGLAATSAVTVNNSAPGAPAILPTDGALLDGAQTVLATPPAGGDAPTGIEIDGAALATTETLGAGTSTFVFSVGSNSIEVRYTNHVIVNGRRIDLVDRDYVSETVRLDVPSSSLVPGRNTIRFVAGVDRTSCGDNHDDFAISGLGLEVAHGTVTPVDVEPSYALGDGSCGSNATKPRAVDLLFDVSRDVDAPAAGLRADVDTADLEDGEHVITSATAAGAGARRTVVTDNTGPAVASSVPQAGQELRTATPLAVEIDDASGVLDGPHVTLAGETVDPGTPVGPGLEPGDHTLVVTATDVLGNESAHEIAFSSAGIPDAPSDLTPEHGTTDVAGSIELGARVAVPGGGDVTATFSRVESVHPVLAAQGSAPTVPTTTLEVEGEEPAAVDALVPADDATLDSPSTRDVTYQRFEIPAEGDVAGQSVRWEGLIDPQRVATLHVWDGRAWVAGASARGDVEGTTTLTATLADDQVQDGVVHVLVTGTDPFVDDIDDGVGMQEPTDFADRGDYDFSMVHFTDTQYLAEGAVEQETAEERAVWAKTYTDIAQWIVDNAESRDIEYVAHTGDVNENYIRPPADEAAMAQARGEYEFSSAAQQIIDDANIPNGVLAGNHDNLTGTDNGPGALFNEFYGPQRYEDLSGEWEDASYGGPWREGDNQNHFDLFTAGGLDFVAVYLSYGVTTEEAAWADGVLEQYPDRNAMVLTHDYLVPSSSPDGRGSPLATPDGRLVYSKVVEPNPNVFLVMSGHRHGVGINVKQDVGAEGSGVAELVADYQFYEVTAEEAGLTDVGGYTPEQGLRLGASYLRLLQFDVDRSEMIVDTYSPWLDDFAATEYDDEQRYNGLEDDFAIPVDLTSRSTSLATDSVALLATGTEIGTTTVASGDLATVTWDDLEPGALHAWTVTATSAGGGVTTAPVRSFATAPEAGQLVVTTAARAQCLAGTAYVAVRATNDDTVPMDVTLETPYGSRTVPGVEPGRSAYQSFSVRAGSVEAGSAHVSASGDGRALDADVAFDAVDCG
ncbi:metallophosphoesterase [Cellulosimicrobium arenosum]|uniref:Metallophosphoesterase n=1 Tax=Cellulosimicrobium arenosum TaxID=2708133 RepID=A0A927PH00_9MICO|nr:metallophosphoesterase [Cellulosimicrobium arenosum]MBD8080644.1 metallophosphoesterase [Cellulosimicrobium arenosum]